MTVVYWLEAGGGEVLRSCVLIVVQPCGLAVMLSEIGYFIYTG